MDTQASPVAGRDYPRTYQQFLEWFDDDAACRRYLLRCRWPDGFACPRYGMKAEPWTTARGYLHCRVCGREVSATRSTGFEGTRISLRTWFSAMWLATSQKDGTSALGVKRVLGLVSYQTAWAWLHKLRRAMVRPGRDRLRGRIEVDETYVGGSGKGGKRGRGVERKGIVVITVELHAPKGLGRVRMRRVPDVTATSLVPFIRDVAQRGFEILTDGWGGYNQVANDGYTHNRVVFSGTGDPAHVSMPGVHSLAALLKRWLLSTHQGSVSGKHLDYYFDEYTFRFHRRASRSRGWLF